MALSESGQAATESAPGVSAPTRRAVSRRLVYLDALRGFALILMVLNHTGRWWQDGHMTWPRYYFIYYTMAVAAPIFLFLVGFCLPLSLGRARGDLSHHLLPTLGTYAVRGGRIILAGLLLNLLVFPEDPFWSNGVLQTIGLGVLVAAPIGLLARSAGGRLAVAAGAVLFYLSFGWAQGWLAAWVGAHPAGSRVLFLEFPPWPWLALIVFGLVPGERWVEQPDAPSRNRYMRRLTGAGLACLVLPVAYDLWARTPNRFTFKRDFILNNHWTPRPATAVFVIGTTLCMLALFYRVGEVRKWRLTWLVTLGQTALFLYFVHHLIVLTLVNQRLHLVFNGWWTFAAANLALMALLLGIGRAWMWTKRAYRERWPRLSLAGRASG